MRSCDKLHLCDHLELNEGAYFYKKELIYYVFRIKPLHFELLRAILYGHILML